MSRHNEPSCRDTISEDTFMTQFAITRRSLISRVATGASLAATTSSGTIVGSVSAQVALKTFVLVPGPFAGAGTGAG